MTRRNRSGADVRIANVKACFDSLNCILIIFAMRATNLPKHTLVILAINLSVFAKETLIIFVMQSADHIKRILTHIVKEAGVVVRRNVVARP